MIDLDDDRLAEVLGSMSDLLVTQQPAGAAVPSAGGAHRRRRPFTLAGLAGLAAAAALVTVVSVAPLRDAVADWLGIGSTRIDIDPTPPTTIEPIPSIDEGLTRIDPATAEELLGTPLPDLDTVALGAPVEYAIMPEGGVLVVWADRSTLWIHEPDMHPGMLFDKLVSAEAAVERVDDLGEDALAVSGEHVVHTPHRTLAADTTVLWKRGAWEYRLESDRLTADLIDVAREIDDELS